MCAKHAKRKAPAVPRRGIYPWLRLAVAVAVLAGLMFVIAPWGLRLPGYRQMDRFIATHAIRATAVYYTDLEEFARAESAIRDGMRYAPDQYFNVKNRP